MGRKSQSPCGLNTIAQKQGSAEERTKRTKPTQPTGRERKPDRLEALPVELVHPTHDNQRRIDPGSASIRNLMESIEAHGLLHPVIVREHPEQPGHYDLRAGARRYTAHVQLGLPTILALVRDLTDQEAKEVTAIENLQREDPSLLEQARSVALLLETGQTREQVAARIGRSVTWVARRQAIAKGLIQEWQDLTDTCRWPGKEGETDTDETDEPDENDGKTVLPVTAERGPQVALTGQHLEILAALPPDTQRRLYKRFAGQERWRLDPHQMGNFRVAVAIELADLSKAPWDTADASLLPVKAGACSECRQRSGAQPELWDSDTSTREQCLSADCYSERMAAYLDRQKQALSQEHGTILEVATDHVPYVLAQQDERMANLPQASAAHTWQPYQLVQAGTKGAKPALVAYGPGTGTLVWVKQNQGHSVTPKHDGPKTIEEKRHELELRRRAEACRRIQDAIGSKNYDWNCLPENHRLALVTVMGTQHNERLLPYTNAQNTWRRYDSYLEEGVAAKAWEALWKDVAPVLQTRLQINGLKDVEDAQGKAAGAWNEAIKVCNVLGLDIQGFWKDACVEIPEPKAWARQE